MRYAAVFALTASLLAACGPMETKPENKAPTVTLTPAAAQSVVKDAPATKLTATATDDGTIAKVEFLDGTTVVATDSSAPYEYTPPTATVGEKTYTAKAFDDKGLTGVSAGVKVTVTPPVVVPTANVRVVHAASDAPPVDIFLNGATPAALTNLIFGSVQPTSAYASIPAVSTVVKVSATGKPITDAVFTSPAIVPAADTNYTVIALGKLGSTPPTFELGVFADNKTAPAAGSAKIRVIHAASTVGKVNVYASAPGAALPATPNVAALEFKKASEYLTVPAADYQFRVTPSDAVTVVIDVPTYKLESGKIYTVIALDPAPTKTVPTVLPLVDN